MSTAPDAGSTPQAPDVSIWSDGSNRVFVLNGATLPPSCVKCNSTEDLKQIAATLYWLDPRLLLWLLLNWLGIIIIAYMIFTRTASVNLSVCRTCRGRRMKRIFVALLLLTISLASVALCISFSGSFTACIVWGVLAGIVFLSMIVYVPIAVPYCTTSRLGGEVGGGEIGSEVVPLYRIGEAFRASLEVRPAPPKPKPHRYEKATGGDIALSIFLPGWGIIVGLMALIKGEGRRASTMITIGVVGLIIWGVIVAGSH